MAQTNKINVYRIKDPSIPDSELVKIIKTIACYHTQKKATIGV